MYESFISDLSIFSNEFSSFIDTNDRPAILYKIQQKHIGELEDNLNFEDKKIEIHFRYQDMVEKMKIIRDFCLKQVTDNMKEVV